jgi:hypothetical protein
VKVTITLFWYVHFDNLNIPLLILNQKLQNGDKPAILASSSKSKKEDRLMFKVDTLAPPQTADSLLYGRSDGTRLLCVIDDSN